MSGKHIKIGVIDSSFDITNPLVAARLDRAGSVDHVDGDAGSLLYRAQTHGQMVLGAMLRDNAALPNLSMRLPDSAAFELHNTTYSSVTIRTALRASSDCDVVNMSFGFTTAFSDTLYNSAFKADVYDPILSGAASGRGGLGVNYVAAGGNNRSSLNDSTFHTLQNTEFVTAVAAVDSSEAVASFSSAGENLLTAAHGVSVDVLSIPSITGRTETTASGTSFAAPKIATLQSEMLSLNGALGYRDVQLILALASRDAAAPEGGRTANGATGWNGGGLTYSRDLGFGIADRAAALALAETWEAGDFYANRAIESSVQTFSSSSGRLSHNSPFTRSFDVKRAIDVEHVNLRVELYHADFNDLVIEIVSPFGTVSRVMANALAPSQQGGWLKFDFGVRRFMGEEGDGRWTVRLLDNRDSSQTGYVTRLDLRVTGSQASDNDTYVFTEDFAANWTEARGSYADGVGVNTLNFAAIHSPLVLDLTGASASEVAGKSLAFSYGATADRIFLGSGADRLTGTDRAETIHMRGGDDTVLAGGGDDVIHHLSGADRVDGGAGVDAIVFTARVAEATWTMLADGWTRLATATSTVVCWAVENFRFLDATLSWDALFGGSLEILGTEAADRIETGERDEIVRAGAGDDLILGSTGDDRIEGGAGFDAVDYAALSAGLTLLAGQVAKAEGGDALVDVERVVGTAHADRMTAGAGVQTLIGADGDDALTGDDAANLLDGGLGADALDGGAGADTLLGGAGDDMLIGGAGSDRVDGGEGSDTAVLAGVRSSYDVRFDAFGAAFATLRGTTEVDALLGVETLAFDDASVSVSGLLADATAAAASVAVRVHWGGGGNDVMTGTIGRDAFVSSAGNDVFRGGLGLDYADYSRDRYGLTYNNGMVNDGQRGTDRLEGVEVVIGSNANDSFFGWTDAMELRGLGGNDRIMGGMKADVLRGGAGSDTITAYRSDSAAARSASDLETADRLYGDAGDDWLYGGRGDNVIEGGAGFDRAWGADGDDLMWDADSAGDMRGGNGDDVFVFTAGHRGLLMGEAGRDAAVLSGAGTFTIAKMQDAGFELFLGDGAGEGAAQNLRLGGAPTAAMAVVGVDSLIFGDVRDARAGTAVASFDGFAAAILTAGAARDIRSGAVGHDRWTTVAGFGASGDAPDLTHVLLETDGGVFDLWTDVDAITLADGRLIDISAWPLEA